MNGNSTSTATPFVYRVLRPIISNLLPNDSPEAGGGQITIVGANFTQPLRVLIGGQTASIVSVNAAGTQIVAIVPRFTGTFPTIPCGNLNSGTQKQDVSVDVQVVNLETTCADTATRALTYHPADTACNGATPVAPQCSNGIDDDGDGLIDFGAGPTNDPGCTSATDPSEGP